MRILLGAVILCAIAHADPNVASVARGLDPVPQWPTLVATKTGVVIEGKAIASITNGDVDPSEKEGGVLGIKIPRLATFAKAMQPPPTGMTLVLDPTTSYQLMIELVFSLKSTGIKQFALVAKTGTKLGAIPLTLPDKTPGADDKSLKLVVAVTRDKLLVWSISGQEGTLQKPKATLKPTELDKLTAAVADIKKRHTADTSVIVMCDGSAVMSLVVPLLAAVRVNTDGKPLFPDVLLSSGFE